MVAYWQLSLSSHAQGYGTVLCCKRYIAYTSSSGAVLFNQYSGSSSELGPMMLKLVWISAMPLQSWYFANKTNTIFCYFASVKTWHWQ